VYSESVWEIFGWIKHILKKFEAVQNFVGWKSSSHVFDANQKINLFFGAAISVEIFSPLWWLSSSSYFFWKSTRKSFLPSTSFHSCVCVCDEELFSLDYYLLPNLQRFNRWGSVDHVALNIRFFFLLLLFLSFFVCVWIYGWLAVVCLVLVVPVSCTKRFDEGRTTTHTTTYTYNIIFTIFDDRCCIFTSPLFSPLFHRFLFLWGFFFSVGPGVCVGSSRWEEQEKEAPFFIF
jgi:hypothetical protein